MGTRFFTHIRFLDAHCDRTGHQDTTHQDTAPPLYKVMSGGVAVGQQEQESTIMRQTTVYEYSSVELQVQP